MDICCPLSLASCVEEGDVRKQSMGNNSQVNTSLFHVL
jgi:hypothetical protein